MSPCLAIALVLLGQQPIPKGIMRPLPGPLPVVAPAAPTSPTLIGLDFKNQTAPMIALTLTQRTGEEIECLGMNASIGDEKRITLESPQPVPFWDAIDRFSAATQTQRSVSPGGQFRVPRPKIQLHSPTSTAIDYGPAAYVGAFRLGPVVVHEHFDRVFLRTKRHATWMIEESPPFYAEIPVMAELNLLSVKLSPIRQLEAIDEFGQSFLDPRLNGEGPAMTPFENDYLYQRTFRVPLVRPSKPSTRLATLRGVIPLEVGRRPHTPTSIVTLEGSSGKTFRDGEIVLDVREFKANGPGSTSLKATLRLEGTRGEVGPSFKNVLAARLSSILTHQIEIVDSQGKSVSMGNGGTQPSNGALRFDRNYRSFPTDSTSMSPTHLRIYRPDWVNWNLPFELKDLPLP